MQASLLSQLENIKTAILPMDMDMSVSPISPTNSPRHAAFQTETSQRETDKEAPYFTNRIRNRIEWNEKLYIFENKPFAPEDLACSNAQWEERYPHDVHLAIKPPEEYYETTIYYSATSRSCISDEELEERQNNGTASGPQAAVKISTVLQDEYDAQRNTHMMKDTILSPAAEEVEILCALESEVTPSYEQGANSASAGDIINALRHSSSSPPAIDADDQAACKMPHENETETEAFELSMEIQVCELAQEAASEAPAAARSSPTNMLALEDRETRTLCSYEHHFAAELVPELENELPPAPKKTKPARRLRKMLSRVKRACTCTLPSKLLPRVKLGSCFGVSQVRS